MIANYHTHTWRCNHATGTEREYIENAIGHYRILGFSDHTPYPFPNGFEDHDKMRMDQLEDYVDTILGLKKEYRDDIEIHLGLEVEYYPAYFDDLVNFVKDFPVEYFILGQHWLGNRIGEVSPYAIGDDAGRLGQYVDQCIEALKTGRFTYLAHPDLAGFTGDRKLYDIWMRKLCRTVSRLDLPVEINLLGIRDHRTYPDSAFWEIAGQEGCKAVFGADAHTAGSVWRPEDQKKARQIADKYRLPVLETVKLIDPFSAEKECAS